MARCITAPRLVTAGQVIEPGFVLVNDGLVEQVGTGSPPDADVVLPHGILAPGLIDLQLNGAFGVDLAEATPDQWGEVVRQLVRTGCTAFTPTFITAPVDALVAALTRYREVRPRLDALNGAARTLGVHVEGPFLSATRRGAHRDEYLCDPTPERIERLLDAGTGGALAYVTLAPERDDAPKAIARLREKGVRVSVGHSDATEDVVRSAVDTGASLVTHLYNAQRPFSHRDPGVVGAALTDERLTAGLIADLHHTDPTAVKLAFAAASGRIALVTDSVAAMGMPAGSYVLGGDRLHIEPGGPPLREDGTIGGSALRLDEAVGNAVACGVDLAVAVDAATRVPADALGHTHLGRLTAGAAADLVWLSDDCHTLGTWVAGTLAYTDPDAPPTRRFPR